MSVLDVVVMVAAVAVEISRWLPRWVGAVAIAVLATAGIATLVAGSRWLIVPVLVAGGVAVVFAVVRRYRVPRRRWVGVVGSVATLLPIAGALLVAWALPVPQFPVPTGPFAVGTRTAQWADPDRGGRVVVAQLWYPAVGGGQGAQYLGRTEGEARVVSAAIAENLGVPGFLLDAVPRARSHAVPDAVAVDGRFPIVLFSPGSGGVRGQDTAWAEDLASRGYLVAGLDHLGDSPVVVLEDGTRVRSRMPEAYAAAWASGDPAAQDRVTDEFIRVRADDLRFALGQLQPLGNGQAVVAGHSFGGATAFTAITADERFAAAIDLDGGLGGALPAPYRQPVLAITSEAYHGNPDYASRLDQALDAGTSTSYRLTIPGTDHFSFTDFALLAPAVVPDANRVAADASADFLAHVLRGAPLDLARYGELAVHPG